MNTARAFGPAAVSGFPNDSHWIVSPPLVTHLFLFFFFLSSYLFPLSALAREIENFLGRKEKKETTITLDPHISPHAKKDHDIKQV